jgi:hypothetical protein
MRAFELAGKQRGAALTWVIVAVLAIALAVWAFTMRGGPSVSTKIYAGKLSAPTPFPSVVNSPVTVTYTVTSSSQARPARAPMSVPATSSSPWTPERGIVVTFVLKTGDASFGDAGTTKSVSTDAQGNATVTIVPARNGRDNLSYRFALGKDTVTDSDTNSFEVVKP